MIRFLLCVTVLPVLQGLTWIRLKKEKEAVTLSECYAAGVLILFLFGEAAACIVIKTAGNFSGYCRIIGGMAAAGGLLSLFVNRKTAAALWRRTTEMLRWKPGAEKRWKRQAMEYVLLVFLIGIQIAGYFLFVPDTGADTMTETIWTAVATDTVFQRNPVTGGLLANGMYPLYKLNALPLLYGALYRLCGMPMAEFLYLAIPVWIIFLNLVIWYAWSGAFFEEQKEKKNLFVIFASLLLIMGDGETRSYAYGLLHNGWSGITAARVTALFFGAYIVYRMLTKKDWLYGITGIVLSVVGLLFARPMLWPVGIAFSSGDTGRRWGMLLIAAVALYLVRERTGKKWKKREIALLIACLLLSLISGSPFAVLGTAYAMTVIWGVAEEWKKGVPMFVGFLILICMTGTVLPFQADIPRNAYVSSQEREIQDKILFLAEKYKGDVMLVAPETVMERARLESGSILLPYGKDLWRDGCNREVNSIYGYEEKALILYEQMKVDYKQPDTIAAMAADLQCDILVLREKMSEEAMRQYGWQRAGDVTGYAVYCR